MTYHANTQRIVLFNLFLLFILTISFTSIEAGWIIYYLIPLAIIIFATIFMDYRLEISSNELTFQVRIFNLPIYRKTMNYKQITGLKFKRIGWAKRCVVVQNQRGLNVRIIDFNPKIIFNDLTVFANNHEIPISKTKEYLILENK